MRNIFVFLLVITAFYGAKAQSCPGMECLHSGYLNESNCQCECLSPYSGDYCERAIDNCQTNQPAECNTYITPDYCDFSNFIVNYCPSMCNSRVCNCGLSECLNGGTFDPDTCSCICPDHYSGEVCQRYSRCAKWLTCDNYGEFNEDTCTCDCISRNFGGDSCDTITCGESEDPEYCSFFPKDSYCSPENVIYDFCPYLCEQCIPPTTTETPTDPPTDPETEPQTEPPTEQPTEPSTEPPTEPPTEPTTEQPTEPPTEPTTEPMTEIPTDSTSDSFNVTDHTSDSFNVTDYPSDQFNVTDYTSDSFNVTDYPSEQFNVTDFTEFLTDMMNTTNAASVGDSTEVISDEPTTETITSCSPLECQNGVIFDAITCSCPCSTGFSGIHCENFDCSHTELDLPYCPDLPCSDPAIYGACPYKCHCLV